MGSTVVRSAVKSGLWQLIGAVVLTFLTGRLEIGVGYQLCRWAGLFSWERMWKKIDWGKR